LNEHLSGAMAYYTVGFDALRMPRAGYSFMSLLEPTGKGADA